MPLTIGEQLKQARLAKNASIDEISKALHIRPFFLEALEDNRFIDIPSMVQVKGFIRLYAGWLDLPSIPLLNILDGKSESYPVEPSPDNSEERTSSLDVRNNPLPEASDGQNSEEYASESQPVTQIDSAYTIPVGIPDRSEIFEKQVSSQHLFLQIGKELRSCREKLDISVDDIEKLTHIRARYLVDMEAGNFNNIPSLVQARGLLNGYAAFLNLDADSLLGTFAEALQQRRLELLPPEPEVPARKKKEKKTAIPVAERTGIRRFLTVDFLVGSVTIIGLVVFGIWSATQVISSRRDSVSKPPAIAQVLAQNPTSELNIQTTGTVEPTVLIRNPDTIGQIPTNLPAQDGAAVNESPTPPVPSLGQASMQVYIVPNQRVFLQVTTGKKVAFIGRTVPGNAYPFTSDERIEVISGNASALKIYYNQKDLGTLGLSGQPLRLIFSKDGITTPTVAITLQPTGTRMATLTLKPTSTPVPPTVTPLIP